jgi:hypothetical protein
MLTHPLRAALGSAATKGGLDIDAQVNSQPPERSENGVQAHAERGNLRLRIPAIQMGETRKVGVRDENLVRAQAGFDERRATLQQSVRPECPKRQFRHEALERIYHIVFVQPAHGNAIARKLPHEQARHRRFPGAGTRPGKQNQLVLHQLTTEQARKPALPTSRLVATDVTQSS